MSQAEQADPERALNSAYEAGSNFIHDIIDEHQQSGRFQGRVHTRFPPEPNGYAHIGHAKSICLNFGTAQKYAGLCNLRLDDTNPTTEDSEYVEAGPAVLRVGLFRQALRVCGAADPGRQSLRRQSDPGSDRAAAR